MRPCIYWRPFCRDLNEPSYRRRYLMVATELQSRGWVLAEGPDESDVLVLQRAARPHEIVDYQRRGKLVIYETNDCYLFRDRIFYRPEERDCIEAADCVVVASRHMAELYSRINPRTVYITEPIEPEFWTTPWRPPSSSQLVVSWHGMRDNLQYWHDVLPAFRAAKVRLRIVMPQRDRAGRSNAAEVAKWGVPFDFIEWDLRTFVANIAAAHAGVAVLPDTEFCRCKSPHKCAGYQALGMPCVCSDVAPYREVVRHGENGLLAGTLDEWEAALDMLRNDGERERIGAAARDAAERFRLEFVASLWERLLVSLYEAGPAGVDTWRRGESG